MVRFATGAAVNSRRDLIRVTGWIATALLAPRAGLLVARKRDCHRAYRRHINDTWTLLLEDLYQRCRTEWGYRVPAGPPEQQMLRRLCERSLQFENYFLMVYKNYLLTQLRSSNEVAQGRALWVLGHIIYHDRDVQRAVQVLEGSGDQYMQQVAKETLALFTRD